MSCSLYPLTLYYTSIQKIKEDVKGIDNKKPSADEVQIMNINEWKTYTPTGTTHIGEICFGNGVFVGRGDKEGLFYSTDGINWTNYETPITSIEYINYYNDKFICFSYQYKESCYSYDGKSWTKFEMPSEFIGCKPIICYGNGLYVMININGGYIYHSYDGLKWIPEKEYNLESGRSICFGNGKFIIISDDNNKGPLISSDGLTWDTRNDLTISGDKLVYINNRFICFRGIRYAATGNYSYDGIEWTKFTFNNCNVYKEDIIYCDGIYVLNGEYIGNTRYSLDLSDWTPFYFNKNGELQGYYTNGMCYGNGKLIITYSYHENQNSMICINSTNLMNYIQTQMIPKSSLLDSNQIKPSLIPISTFYPVNSVYMSTKSDFKPGDTFGGTWESITSGIEGVYMWKRTA